MCFAFQIVYTSLLLSELCLAVLAMVSECTTSPDLFCPLPECQCFYPLSCHGLVATLRSISGHILALGQEASGRLPDLVSTLGSVSGFILALG
jgi:hypothetical protein